MRPEIEIGQQWLCQKDMPPFYTAGKTYEVKRGVEANSVFWLTDDRGQDHCWGIDPFAKAFVLTEELREKLLDNNYAALRDVLDAAYAQSAEGKGKERHANERDFTQQPIMVIGRAVGVGFPAGQVQKKIGEAVGMSERGDHDAAYREALGAIVYAAAAALLFLEKKNSD